MKAILSEKGQVTIPKALRERLGLRAGSVLDFTEDHGRLVATRADPVSPVAAVYGILRTGTSTDALVDDLRGQPDGLDR
jgi:antitoxin PrlF